MIRFGIIGRNFIVDTILAAMNAVPEVRPTALYSRDPEAAAAFAGKYGIPYVFGDLKAMADHPEVDAVYIASPNSCHYEQSKLILEHGKHVLCEKPADSNAAQVCELVRLAEEKDLIWLEGMRPVFSDALKILEQNLPRIGPLRQVSINYCKPSSRYRAFLEKGSGVNTFDPALSNAAVMDLGCYGIHSLVRLFGKPEAVCAQASHLENGFEASGTVLLGYPGFTASVTYSKVSYLDLPVVFAGEKGQIILDQINHTQRMRIRMNGSSEEDLGFRPAEPNDMIFELRAFDLFVSEHIRPVRENENSIITAEILDEARHQTGTVFPSDPILE